MGVDTYRIVADNYQICTSTTRPVSPYGGMMVYETDTGLHRVYTGSAWKVPYPLGVVFAQAASAASSALAGIGDVITIPGTTYTINNTDGVARKYMVRAKVRVNMAGGSNGLYRPLVTNGSALVVGGGPEQVMVTVAGASGAGGSSTEHVVTVAAGGTQIVGAGALRVTGGSATDTLVGGYIVVEDGGA